MFRKAGSHVFFHGRPPLGGFGRDRPHCGGSLAKDARATSRRSVFAGAESSATLNFWLVLKTALQNTFSVVRGLTRSRCAWNVVVHEGAGDDERSLARAGQIIHPAV